MTATASQDWLTAVARRHSPLFLSTVLSGQDRGRIEAHAGLAVGFPRARRNGLALEYPRADIAAARAETAARRQAEGLAFFDDYSRRCLDSCQALLAVSGRVAESEAPLAERAAEYTDGVLDHSAFLQTLIVTQFELEDAMNDIIAARIADPEERVRVADALKLALEPTHETLNLTAMLEVARSVQSAVEGWEAWLGVDPADLIVRVAAEHPGIWAQVESYTSEFGWMGRMYYAGTPIGVADVILRVQNMLNHDCAARLAAIGAAREAALAERTWAIARLGSDAEAEQLAAVLSRYMHLRSYRLDVYFIAHERLIGLHEEVGALAGVGGHEEVVHLDCAEFLAAAAGRYDTGKLRAAIADRQLGWGFQLVDGDFAFEAPIAVADAPAAALATGPLQGVTACAGQARGRVRVIASDADMFAMTPGEILVTTMTMPSLMLAVEKAGAIVTDEGGMLCHAAIVSRELDIPCVIATGNATRRLHTGDEVEVDADAGVVHVLT